MTRAWHARVARARGILLKIGHERLTKGAAAAGSGTNRPAAMNLSECTSGMRPSSPDLSEEPAPKRQCLPPASTEQPSLDEYGRVLLPTQCHLCGWKRSEDKIFGRKDRIGFLMDLVRAGVIKDNTLPETLNDYRNYREYAEARLEEADDRLCCVRLFVDDGGYMLISGEAPVTQAQRDHLDVAQILADQAVDQSSDSGVDEEDDSDDQDPDNADPFPAIPDGTRRCGWACFLCWLDKASVGEIQAPKRKWETLLEATDYFLDEIDAQPWWY